MAEYQQMREPDGSISASVLRRADSAVIPDDPANRDRAEYTAWVEAGNIPDPPDPLPEPQPPAPDPNVRLDNGIDAAVAAWNANTPAGRETPGGGGGLSTEERLVRLEQTTIAKTEGQLPPGSTLTFRE